MRKGGTDIWDPVEVEMEVIREKEAGRGGEIITWDVKGVVSQPIKRKLKKFYWSFGAILRNLFDVQVLKIMLLLILGSHRSGKAWWRLALPKGSILVQHGEGEGWGPCGPCDGILESGALRTDPGSIWEHP